MSICVRRLLLNRLPTKDNLVGQCNISLKRILGNSSVNSGTARSRTKKGVLVFSCRRHIKFGLVAFFICCGTVFSLLQRKKTKLSPSSPNFDPLFLLHSIFLSFHLCKNQKHGLGNLVIVASLFSQTLLARILTIGACMLSTWLKF